ncbi:MAG: hypothetical protein R6U98_10110, partial [Pirellulaceae bacterium]
PEPEPPPTATKVHGALSQPQEGDTARVQGLGDIPADWPQLPENASLQAELGWCQANRLRIVEELPSGSTRVHLDQAGTPAPSMASLGWLETSIRSYAKYVDVVARSLSVVADEQAMVRRERMAIGRIRALLAQMRVEGDDDASPRAPRGQRIAHVARADRASYSIQSRAVIADRAHSACGSREGRRKLNRMGGGDEPLPRQLSARNEMRPGC